MILLIFLLFLRPMMFTITIAYPSAAVIAPSISETLLIAFIVVSSWLILFFAKHFCSAPIFAIVASCFFIMPYFSQKLYLEIFKVECVLSADVVAYDLAVSV